MGVTSLEEGLSAAQGEGLRRVLEESMKAHKKLENRTRQALNRFHDSGKELNPMLRGMGWLKTNVKLATSPGDHTVADLMTDGCNMGVKYLSKYLNQYAAADEDSKDIAKTLIHLEENLAVEMRGYLA
jgi:hypothetical protein